MPSVLLCNCFQLVVFAGMSSLGESVVQASGYELAWGGSAVLVLINTIHLFYRICEVYMISERHKLLLYYE